MELNEVTKGLGIASCRASTFSKLPSLVRARRPSPVDFSATHSVSLKELFPSAQFIGADDIRCSACDQFPESHSSDWVFATGLSPWSAPERDVLLAQSHGALGILTEQYLPTSLPQCIVDNVGDAFAQLAMKLAGNPCDKILTIGVVGTHGKQLRD